MNSFKLKKADIILLAAVIAVGGIMAAVLFLHNQSGSQVQVRVSGTVAASYPLDQNATYTISGVNGGTNVLVIEDGTARIEEASCPDGLCINTGRVSRDGQSIVCLPNQVVVEIVSDTTGIVNEDSGVDITAG